MAGVRRRDALRPRSVWRTSTGSRRSTVDIQRRATKLQHDVIDRGIFAAVADPGRKAVRYIHLYQKADEKLVGAYRQPQPQILIAILSRSRMPRLPLISASERYHLRYPKHSARPSPAALRF